MFCKECGTQLVDSAIFCKECGTRVSNHSPVFLNKQSAVIPKDHSKEIQKIEKNLSVLNAKKKKLQMILLGLAVAILVMIGLIIGTAVKKGKQKEVAMHYGIETECVADAAQEEVKDMILT